MKNNSHMRWLTLAAGLCAAANIATASEEATFTDSWHDTLAGNLNIGFFVNTAGSASTSISLPLDGVDLGAVNSETTFTLSIGPAGNTSQLVSDSLGDTTWIPGKTSATFVVMDPNSGTDVGHATISWTATTLSVTGSATNDVLGEEEMFSTISDGSNASYTLPDSITGTNYEITVSFAAFFYDNPNLRVKGSDREVDVFGDGDGMAPNGDYPLEAGSITGTADFTPPVLTITAPPADTKVYNPDPVVDLKGHASDSVGVTNVEYYVNGDTNNEFEIAPFPDETNDSVAWTAEVDLGENSDAVVGSNVITVVATDAVGNMASVSRTFIWYESNFVDVIVNPANAGKITGSIHNGQPLEVGFGYFVTAASTNKDWIFSDWTDASETIVSSNATFEYLDTNNADTSLTANFLPNPFNDTGLAGTYTALFYDTNNGPELDDTGYITLTVTSNGMYSGKLSLASITSSSFSLTSGQLAEEPNGSNATAELFIDVGTVSKPEYLSVILQVATDTNLSDTNAGMLDGFVNAYSDKTEDNLLDSAEIQGQLSLYNTNIAAGLYHFYINSVSNDPAGGPGGYSYGSATVSDKKGAVGAVTLALNLADGTSPTLSFSTFLASNGVCPLYASLYSGKGVIMGWMQFATDGSGVISNNAVNWLKMPVADKFYTNGFAATPNLSGHIYLPPKAGTNIMGWTQGIFIADSGYEDLSLPNQTNAPVKFDPTNNTFAATNKVTITFTPTTGALTGSFYPAVGKASFSGVVVPGVFSGAGYGFYTDTNKETGPIWIIEFAP